MRINIVQLYITHVDTFSPIISRSYITKTGFISENEDLLIHLKTVSEVTSFCAHIGLPYHDCDTIKTENPNNLGDQKFSVIKKWREKKKRTWKEFIIPFALLGKCVIAKELATEYFVYFDAKLKHDQRVLKRCTDINDRD